MDTQRFQEACLQKYHTNSKRTYVLFSIFISTLINFTFFVALYSFLRQSKISVVNKTTYAVSIVQPENSKKNIISHNEILNKKRSGIKSRISKTVKTPSPSMNTSQTFVKSCIGKIADNKKSKKAMPKKLDSMLKLEKKHTDILLSKGKIHKNKRNNISKSNRTQNFQPNYINISQSNYKNLYYWIASHKYYPVSALYRNEEGSVVLSFKIDRNRNISFVQISKNSEYKSLNDAAVMIVKKSSPIPENVVSLSKIKLPSVCSLKIVFRIQ